MELATPGRFEFRPIRLSGAKGHRFKSYRVYCRKLLKSNNLVIIGKFVCVSGLFDNVDKNRWN